jgi:hypothetical protein
MDGWIEMTSNLCITICKKCMKVTDVLQIAYYRIPRYIRFTSEFTRTSATGKVQKTQLLAKLVSEFNRTNLEQPKVG